MLGQPKPMLNWNTKVQITDKCLIETRLLEQMIVSGLMPMFQRPAKLLQMHCYLPGAQQLQTLSNK